ncbi:glutamate--tRNA ligase family protein [Campylobacter sp. 19-13652]|uniref:glutamate--tRNA ligase family protein n=1 Tax=Campylobacter sp. 19-13652 TaxID=2840180 RepID=UPI001C76B5B8|nr:glutamate--tRNA ligase family protein [Campylobacter sp. 19-13652]BCX79888.1 glutamyl-Q tRNA(Asp) synthetase [Campylobacter sp. 19-13652]
MQIISRLAPTPSGYLHAGNALNFILTAAITKALNGVLHLRIDDYDLLRYRREYVQNIFDTLKWLDINWDYGSRSVDEFERHFSSRFRQERYKNAIKELDKKGLVYACACSKTKPGAYDENGRYTGLCKSLQKSGNGDKALRIKANNERLNINELFLLVKEPSLKLPKWAWDFVLLKKDSSASYNLASVIDDASLGVNLLVRGLDLRECSYQQSFLSSCLGLSFQDSLFIYHDLLLQDDGKKLSKSSSATALNLNQSPATLYLQASKILGIRECDSLDGMVRGLKVEGFLKPNSFKFGLF